MATGLSLAQTRGNWQMKGIVVGVNKEQFSKSIKTKNGKLMRQISFGIQTSKDSILYVNLSGMEQDYVYFSKRPDPKVKDSKSTVEKVEWSKRKAWKKEGFTLIGVNCGLTKTITDKGEVNDIQHLTAFDACEYIANNLKDGASVFAKGNLEWSHYESNGNMVHASKMMITQLSLCKDVDFADEKFEREASFAQSIVYTDIEKMDNEFALSAKIINYNSVEDATFTVTNEKLALNFKKNVKPFSFVKIWGDIQTARNTEEVKETAEDDGWGNANPMQRLTGAYKKVLLITGADKESIDNETYNEKSVAQCVEEAKGVDAKKKDFESDDDWGNTKSGGSKIVKGDNEDEDDEKPW
jgi:hypothetical protein